MRAKCVFFVLHLGMNIIGVDQSTDRIYVGLLVLRLVCNCSWGLAFEEYILLAKAAKISCANKHEQMEGLFHRVCFRTHFWCVLFVFFVFLSSSLYCCLTLGFPVRSQLLAYVRKLTYLFSLMSAELITLNQTNLATRNNLWLFPHHKNRSNCNAHNRGLPLEGS